jgi:hypothetical protein
MDGYRKVTGRDYLYHVRVRAGKDAKGNTLWEYKDVEGYSIDNVARKLGVSLDDVVYMRKELLR